MNSLSLILFSVCLNAAAQLFLKAGMQRIGHFAFAWNNAMPIALQALTNPFVWAGLFTYAISVVVWMMVLSRVDVNIAYPMVSIGYILVAIAGYLLFNEPLTLTRICGIFVIMGGVYLITRG